MSLNFFNQMAPLKYDMNLKNSELSESSYFQWLQLISTIPEEWKYTIPQKYN